MVDLYENEIVKKIKELSASPEVLKNSCPESEILPCGNITEQQIVNIFKSYAINDKTKFHIDEFILSGGKFKYERNRHGIFYDPTTNSMVVSGNMEIKNKWVFVNNVSNAFYSAFTYNTRKKAGLINFGDFNSATSQVSYLFNSVAEMYNQSIVAFENGKDCWQLFSLKNRDYCICIENALAQNECYVGDKVPELFYPFIANTAILNYSSIRNAIDRNFLKTMEKYDDFAMGAKHVHAKDFFNELDIPTTLTEEELCYLLLIPLEKKQEIEKNYPFAENIQYAPLIDEFKLKTNLQKTYNIATRRNDVLKSKLYEIPTFSEVQMRIEAVSELPVKFRNKFEKFIGHISGIEANNVLLEICKDLIFHNETKKHYEDFIQNDGKIRITKIEGNTDMHIDGVAKIININHEKFWKAVKSKNLDSIAVDFAHELHHNFTINKNDSAGILHDGTGFSNSAKQIKYIGIEMAELFNSTIIAFETDNNKWQELAEYIPDYAVSMKAILESFNLQVGNKIPKYFYPAIANASVIGFASSQLMHVYQSNFIAHMKENSNYKKGFKNIKATDYLHNAEVPVTLSEEQLRSLIQIQQKSRYELGIDDKLSKYIEYGKYIEISDTLVELKKSFDKVKDEHIKATNSVFKYAEIENTLNNSHNVSDQKLQESLKALYVAPNIRIKNQLLKETCEMLISHKKIKQKFKEFLRDGGKVMMSQNKSSWASSYKTDHKTILISENVLWDSVINNQLIDFDSSLTNSLHNDSIAMKNYQRGFNPYSNDLDNTSAQIGAAGLMIGIKFNQSVICFEAGGDSWRLFTEEMPDFAKSIEKTMKKFDVNVGNEVPEKLYPIIANCSVVAFKECAVWKSSSTYHDDFKSWFFLAMEKNPAYGKGSESIPVVKYMHYLNVPVTLSEEQLKSLLLVSESDKSNMEHEGIKSVIECAPELNISDIKSETKKYENAMISQYVKQKNNLHNKDR